jgi:hypothetical protein
MYNNIYLCILTDNNSKFCRLVLTVAFIIHELREFSLLIAFRSSKALLIIFLISGLFQLSSNLKFVWNNGTDAK